MICYDIVAVADDEVISPSELAVLDSLVSGGSALSLKVNKVNILGNVFEENKRCAFTVCASRNVSGKNKN